MVGSRRNLGKRVSRATVPVTPMNLPTTSPAMMPMVIVLLNDADKPASPPTATPVAKNAKMGTATVPETTSHRSAKWAAKPS